MLAEATIQSKREQRAGMARFAATRQRYRRNLSSVIGSS